MKTNQNLSFTVGAALACALGTAITASLLIAALETFPDARRALLIGLVLLVLAIAAAVSLAASPPAQFTPEFKRWMARNKQPMNQTEFAEFIEDNFADIDGEEVARADAIDGTQTPNPYPPGSPAHHSWATSYQAQAASLGGPATPEKSHVTAKNA